MALKEDSTTEPWDVIPTTPQATRTDRTPPSEEIRRIQVDEEDRLAFRVGVNLITLVLIGVGVYFLVRYLWS